ncbi:MAG TPA: ACT domain-containing protein [bacterium]|nr:ACT domain-containing protein [bacterium]HPP30472.1 ACT domain-containing protein [bacterium]
MGKQLSIFVENKPGKINKITGILEKEKINLKAMTIADSGTFGIVKIITDNNRRAFDVLKKANFLVSFQNVVVVEIPDRVGAFHRVAKILEDEKINIEDAYGFIMEEGQKAALILKVPEPERVEKVLKRRGYKLIENF